MSGSQLAPLRASAESMLKHLIPSGLWASADAQSVYCVFTFALFQVRCHVTCFLLFDFFWVSGNVPLSSFVLWFFVFFEKAVCACVRAHVFFFFLAKI